MQRFDEQFPDEFSCHLAILRARLGEAMACPDCRAEGAFAPTIKPRIVVCRGCKRRHHPTAGTLFHDSYLPLRLFLYAMLLVANEPAFITVDFLRRELGLSLSAAQRMLRMIRLHIAALQPTRRMGGPGEIVQVDETGCRNVWSAARGKDANPIILGLVDRLGVQTLVIPDRSSATLFARLTALVEPGSRVVTDQWPGYHRLDVLGYAHSTVNHARAQWVNDAGHHTLSVEQYWSVLKPHLNRLRHACSLEQLPLVLGEHRFKYNARTRGDDPFQAMLRAFPPVHHLRGRGLPVAQDFGLAYSV